jgi:hypothetical protein
MAGGSLEEAVAALGLVGAESARDWTAAAGAISTCSGGPRLRTGEP